MAKVIIPAPFRKYADGLREVMIDSNNLGDVMRGLVTRYKGLSVLLEQPALLSLFINGTMLRTGHEQWDSVTIEDNAEITLIIPIAGG